MLSINKQLNKQTNDWIKIIGFISQNVWVNVLAYYIKQFDWMFQDQLAVCLLLGGKIMQFYFGGVYRRASKLNFELWFWCGIWTIILLEGIDILMMDALFFAANVCTYNILLGYGNAVKRTPKDTWDYVQVHWLTCTCSLYNYVDINNCWNSTNVNLVSKPFLHPSEISSHHGSVAQEMYMYFGH